MKLEGKVQATVLFPLRGSGDDEQVFLARKTAKIGVGLYNGIGGGVEDGETIDGAAVRETQEETAIVVERKDLERRAFIRCNNYNKRGERFVCELFVYIARRFKGEPALTDDSALTDPRWFKTKDLPLREMMFGDRQWIAPVLKGERILGEIFYAPGMESFEKPPRMEAVSQEVLDRSWK